MDGGGIVIIRFLFHFLFPDSWLEMRESRGCWKFWERFYTMKRQDERGERRVDACCGYFRDGRCVDIFIRTKIERLVILRNRGIFVWYSKLGDSEIRNDYFIKNFIWFLEGKKKNNRTNIWWKDTLYTLSDNIHVPTQRGQCSCL